MIISMVFTKFQLQLPRVGPCLHACFQQFHSIGSIDEIVFSKATFGKPAAYLLRKKRMAYIYVACHADWRDQLD